ncbi:uncharacterized protein AB675_2595 [Cyphellophora attinorum]|uniref:Uncharacterized protein n=1 Tax=Cyphellophora attinorum TaxID=1664694 RepID=A0A0N1P297_9EURO|nr:uncharacterized protein AB675_2595 [Phialophora attinorum]KPI45165.1 hypothetical protein AB675_2595 [Phialophora attinorum]
MDSASKPAPLHLLTLPEEIRKHILRVYCNGTRPELLLKCQKHPNACVPHIAFTGRVNTYNKTNMDSIKDVCKQLRGAFAEVALGRLEKDVVVPVSMSIIGRADYRGANFIIGAEMRQFLKSIKSIHINLNHDSEWLCASPTTLWSFFRDGCPNLVELTGIEREYLSERLLRAPNGKCDRETLEAACSSKGMHWSAESALRGLQHIVLDRGWGPKGELPSVKFRSNVRFCAGNWFFGAEKALIIAQATQIDDGQIETTVRLVEPVVDIY